LITQVLKESAASGRLQPGDLITSVDDRPILTRADLSKALGSHKPGEVVGVEVRRGGVPKRIDVKTSAAAGSSNTRAALGVDVSPHHRAPISVVVDAGEIKGPSAGLMLALGIYDLLTPEDLTGGRKIAGTGTIENSGGRDAKVGPVGAIELKVEGARREGATVFMAPIEEAPAARRAAPGGMKVIAVSTLRQAIAALEKLNRSS
jgi:Lon-like protease